MKRRGFLKLLALLPFAPKLAEAAAARIKPKFINPLPEALNLLDFAKQCEAKDYQLPVIEALNRMNPLLQDVKWQDVAWRDRK